jgi:hypothetical protein
MLIGIVEDGDDDLVEQRSAPLDDVEVSVSWRIEGTGKDCTTHNVCWDGFERGSGGSGGFGRILFSVVSRGLR